MATPYDGKTNEELIALLLERDAEIAAMKADQDTDIIMQTKIDDLSIDITEMSRRKQDLPNRSALTEFERTALDERYGNEITAKQAEKSNLERILAEP